MANVQTGNLRITWETTDQGTVTQEYKPIGRVPAAYIVKQALSGAIDNLRPGEKLTVEVIP